MDAPPTPINQRRHKAHHYIPARKRNMNLGFSVDFQTHHKSPLSRVDELRHYILEERGMRSRSHSISEAIHTEVSAIEGDEDLAEDITSLVEPHDGNMSDNKGDSSSCHVAADTFDNCLHIANQMESVLEFFYKSEDDPNVVKVTEIFALDDPRGPKPDITLNDLQWDNYCEMKEENDGGDDLLSMIDNMSLPRSNMSDMSSREEVNVVA